MKAELEKDIQRQCLEYLKLRGIWAWRQNRTGVYDQKRKKYRQARSVRGLSDILGCLNGCLLAIEVKRPGEKPTEDQAWFLETVRMKGGYSVCVHSVKELEAFLAEVM